MAEIVLKDIHKYYGSNHVLKGVSLEIYEGTRVGLLGKNGSGKTTLFKILSGQEPYEKGEMQIIKGRRIGVLDQIPEYPDGFSVYHVIDSAFSELHEMKNRLDALQAQMAQEHDEILFRRYGALLSEYEARGGYTAETSIKRVCTGLGIDEAMQARPFAALSGGEKTRVNLARIILMDTHILLLDEPTNHLDIHAVEWLEDYLKEYLGTVVVISHDRYFLDRVAGKIIEIVEGVAYSYEGNYSKFALQKEQNRLDQMKRYEQEQKKIRQLEAAVKRMHDWANRADSAKMHRRAFSMEKRIERLAQNGADKPATDRKISKNFKSEEFSGMDILLIKGLKKSFGEKAILRDADLLIKRNDRVVLLGNNGTGKTTLLKIIRGELTQDAGIVKVGLSVKMAYLPQHIQFDQPDLTVMETIRHALLIDEGSARNLLAGFMFRGEDVFKKVGTLSGGEKSRLKLCLLMQSDVNLLILDEPTNHLDILSREWMEEAIDAFEGTILFVSHDRYFIRKFASGVAELEDGKLTYFDGDYESFRAYKKELEEEKRQRELLLKAEKPKTDTRVKKPDPKALEKKMTQLEAHIAKAEEDITAIEEEMQIHQSDYEKLNELIARKEARSKDLEDFYAKWLEVQQALKELE